MEDQIHFDQEQQEQIVADGIFGDDDEDDELNIQQEQHQQYQDDLDADDILGLDGGEGGEDPGDNESSLLMRFCPHDSSMLYPKVRHMNRSRFPLFVVKNCC